MFDEATHQWQLRTASGEVITARFLISAIGAYIPPKARPDIPGLDRFEACRNGRCRSDETPYAVPL